MAGNTKDYNRRYYLRNKNRILAHRKVRYIKDVDYRDAILNRSKARTVIERAGRMVNVQTVTHDGHLERAYSMSELCTAVNRHHTVLYRWRYTNVMPRPIHMNNRNHGIYAESQVLLMKMLIDLAEQGEKFSYEQMGLVMFALWRKKFSASLVMATLERARRTKSGNQKGRNQKNRTASGSVRSKGRKRSTKGESGSKVLRRTG